MNSRENLKFDWLRVTFLSSGGLHYDQESFGGELCTWMKKWHGCECGDTFLIGSTLKVKFLGQPQSLGQETWPLEKSNLNKKKFQFYFTIWLYWVDKLFNFNCLLWLGRDRNYKVCTLLCIGIVFCHIVCNFSWNLEFIVCFFVASPLQFHKYWHSRRSLTKIVETMCNKHML